MNAIIKTCGCGLSFTPATWAALPYRGSLRIPASETEPAECLILRDCPCGSTISVDISNDITFAVAS